MTVHSDLSKTKAGSRQYIHAEDVADALIFLLNYNIASIPLDDTELNAKKFNIVGKDEIDNLQLAQFVAKTQGKELLYEMVDYHSQRPGRDLGYALSGSKMEKMGWSQVSL